MVYSGIHLFLYLGMEPYIHVSSSNVYSMLFPFQDTTHLCSVHVNSVLLKKEVLCLSFSFDLIEQ
jgi:nitrate reductase gamma subunit